MGHPNPILHPIKLKHKTTKKWELPFGLVEPDDEDTMFLQNIWNYWHMAKRHGVTTQQILVFRNTAVRAANVTFKLITIRDLIKQLQCDQLRKKYQ